MEFEELKKIIAGVLNVDPREITEETTFAQDLDADSLDEYQIIMEVEDRFGIEVPVESIENIKTVGEALEIIRNIRGV
ncbi:MAG: acyl carrier protein [Lachnospiraceae bacterium]|nr:acyl carrier protein [Lachnospiraceae bacterium]